MKKTLLSCLLLLSLAVTASAQIVKGDMNDDGTLDISDVVSSVNVILGSQPMSYISASDILDPYMVDNSKVVGTWYKTKTETVTFGEDGTTDYEGATKYEFMPYQGRVILYNSADTPIGGLDILKATDDYLYISVMGAAWQVSVYTKSKPVSKVSSITLSETSIVLEPDATQRLTATILPADADDKSVTWSSSDENIATVINGLVIAIGEGTAIITCSANDGSGVTATCRVRVRIDHSDDYAYVDLRLSSGTLWATMNVGADSPEDYGDYFAWGETVGYNDGYTTFDWTNYRHCNGSKNTLTKYCNDSNYGYNGFTDTLTELEAEDDAAYVNWGIKWRMPTDAQWTELRTECTWSWTTKNGVNGRLVTGPNGNSIFLPAAGLRYNGSLNGAGSHGDYWSLSLYTDSPSCAYIVDLGSYNVYRNYLSRYYGFSVRPVRSE